MKAYDSSTALAGACAIAGEDVAPATNEFHMGKRFQGHRFFRVVRTNLNARFVQLDDGGRFVRIAVAELALHGRHGNGGLFGSGNGDGSTCLDFHDILLRCGVECMMRFMIIWRAKMSAAIQLMFPLAAADGRSAVQLRGTSSAMALTTNGASKGREDRKGVILRLSCRPSRRQVCV